MMPKADAPTSELESSYAWWRLIAAVGLGCIGNVGMWSVPVVLPAVQAEFAVARADASLPFTLAVVHAAAGHCRRHRFLWQLPCRRYLAANPAAIHCKRRLARDTYRRRHVL